MSNRVLVIDDDTDVRRRLADELGACGWETFEASRLRQALDCAALRQPELIVTELILPDVHGFHFGRTLRSMVEHDVHLVAVTRAKARAFDQAIAAGFDLVLPKPIDGATLVGELERFRASAR